MIIQGATDTRAPKVFAPIATGPWLTLIHLIGIRVTTVSVYSARSMDPALFAGQLWVFWVAPIIGAVFDTAPEPTVQDEMAAPATTRG